MISRAVPSPIQLDQSLTHPRLTTYLPLLSRSSSASLPSVSLAIHLNLASGAYINRVKWGSSCSSGAVSLSSDEAVSVLIFANREVVERISARSKGVLSFA